MVWAKLYCTLLKSTFWFRNEETTSTPRYKSIVPPRLRQGQTHPCRKFRMSDHDKQRVNVSGTKIAQQKRTAGTCLNKEFSSDQTSSHKMECLLFPITLINCIVDGKLRAVLHGKYQSNLANVRDPLHKHTTVRFECNMDFVLTYCIATCPWIILAFLILRYQWRRPHNGEPPRIDGLYSITN